MKVVKSIGASFFFVCLGMLFSCSNSKTKDQELFKNYAIQLQQKIFKYYRASSCSYSMNLFHETYPYNGDVLTYVVDGDTVKHEKMACLWVTFPVFSGLNALYEATKDAHYLDLLEKTMLPVVACYRDTLRSPSAFQSDPSVWGLADRYYDDNAWLGLEYLKLFELTGNQSYLKEVDALWTFLEKAHDDVLGGGLYWCEQKKYSKNTCSNVPVLVLASRLYEVTSDEKYLIAAKEHYQWIKTSLLDLSDGLYFDSVLLDGTIDKRKYSYNSGHMMLAASLLYGITGEKMYLNDARNLAQACYRDFFIYNEEGIHLLCNGNIWFAAVMLRGYEELYKIDQNPVYLKAYKQILKQLWESSRDENGLFANNCLGTPSRYETESKNLQNQAALVEMYARLSAVDL